MCSKPVTANQKKGSCQGEVTHQHATGLFVTVVWALTGLIYSHVRLEMVAVSCTSQSRDK